jgi:hypothetical protein
MQAFLGSVKFMRVLGNSRAKNGGSGKFKIIPRTQNPKNGTPGYVYVCPTSEPKSYKSSATTPINLLLIHSIIS